MTCSRPPVVFPVLLLAALLAPACQPHLASVEPEPCATEERESLRAASEERAEGGLEDESVGAIDRDRPAGGPAPVENEEEDPAVFPRLAARSRLFESARGALRERRRR